MIDVKLIKKPKGGNSGDGRLRGSGFAGMGGTAEEAKRAVRADKADYADLSEYANRAGYASRAAYSEQANDIPKGSPLYDRFLRKDIDDETKGSLGIGKDLTVKGLASLLKGLVAKAESFFAGIRNTGDIINNGGIQTKNLTVTGKASFFELEIIKAKAAGGVVFVSPGEFHADLVEETDDGYKLYQNAEKGGDFLMQTIEPDDQLFCCDVNLGEGAYTEAANHYYWRRVTAAPTEYIEKTIDGNTCRCLTITLSKDDRDMSSDDTPRVGDDLCVCGNRTNQERMGVIITSAYRSFDSGLEAPYWAQYTGMNDYDFPIHRQTCFANNRNSIVGDLHVKSETGDILPVPCDMGEWEEKPYSYYNRVSHNGSLWLCVIEPGTTTTEEPGTGNAWQQQVSKGDEPVMLSIFTNTGNILRNGQGQITLIAVVTQNGKDITESFQNEDFSWQRYSGNDEYDMEWNNRHSRVGRSITVSAEDVWKQAQFECVLNDI